MIKTRHVAGTLAVAMLSLPFIGASPANAAAGTISTITGPLQTGDTENIAFTAGDETGQPYAVELWQGSTQIATLKTGTDVDAIQGTTFKWTIPTGIESLVGTGFSIKLVSTADATPFTAISSGTFAIEASSVNTLVLDTTTPAAGGDVLVKWTNTGKTGDRVDIALVQTVNGKDKVTALKKGVSNTTANSATNGVSVTIPAKTVAGAYKIRVTPSNKAAKAGDSSAVTVGAPTIGAVALTSDGTTAVTDAALGATIVVVPTSVNGPVKLELVNAAGKVVATIAKEAASADEVDFVIPAKLEEGTYKVKATLLSLKTVTLLSGGLTVSGWPFIDVADISGPVTQGQTVTVQWETEDSVPAAVAVDAVNTITLIDQATLKETKLDSKELTEAGNGVYEWVVAQKLTPGSYKIRVSNNALKAGDGFKDETAAFTVAANTTVLED